MAYTKQCPSCGSDHTRIIDAESIYIPGAYGQPIDQVDNNTKYDWDTEMFVSYICDDCKTENKIIGTINWSTKEEPITQDDPPIKVVITKIEPEESKFKPSDFRTPDNLMEFIGSSLKKSEYEDVASILLKKHVEFNTPFHIPMGCNHDQQSMADDGHIIDHGNNTYTLSHSLLCELYKTFKK